MAVVENTSLACGSGDELHLNNVNAIFRFGVSLTNVEVKYGEYGGNINVEVNGQCENVDNFIDLPPTMGLGPPVTVMAVDVGTPGNSCGVLTLTGTVNSLTIGGQELWVDELRSTTVDFVRGDANADSTVNITDPIFVLLYLFRGGTCPTCLDSADADDNGAVQITDAIVLLNCLFGGGGPLPPPTPMPTKSHYDPLLSCGPDVMPDTLWCPVFGPCP
jgi:hypothetical protein